MKAEEKTIAALALAGVETDSPRQRPDAPKRQRRCHDMKKKRKRRMAQESRRRNR